MSLKKISQVGVVLHETTRVPGPKVIGHFEAPPYGNVDARFSRRFTIGERVRLQVLFEFFNLLNRANPAAVEQYQNVSSTPLGTPLQFLPGREGQVGLRIEF